MKKIKIFKNIFLFLSFTFLILSLWESFYIWTFHDKNNLSLSLKITMIIISLTLFIFHFLIPKIFVYFIKTNFWGDVKFQKDVCKNFSKDKTKLLFLLIASLYLIFLIFITWEFSKNIKQNYSILYLWSHFFILLFFYFKFKNWCIKIN